MAADLAHVDGNLARALDRVDVVEDAGVLGNAPDLVDRLDDAGLVVGEHDTDEARLRADGAEDIGGVDEPRRLRSHKGGLDTVAGHAPGSLQDRRVLD